MGKGIFLKRLSFDAEDDLVKFLIYFSSGNNSISLEFYGYADEFKEFGEGLMNFPRSITDSVRYELGKSNEQWAYYMLMEVYCFQNNGHSAMHIMVNNNRQAPDSSKAEIYISSVPSSFNKLGQLLRGWNPVRHPEIEWTAE